MALDKQDIELIERMVYKCNDDIAVLTARSFERLEERIDAAETRLYSRFADVEEKIEGSRQDVAEEIAEVRTELREVLKAE